MDDDKILMLEEELRKAKSIAVETERNYEEVAISFTIFAFLYVYAVVYIVVRYFSKKMHYSFTANMVHLQSYLIRYEGMSFMTWHLW